jgi:hypothetical protein
MTTRRLSASGAVLLITDHDSFLSEKELLGEFLQHRDR